MIPKKTVFLFVAVAAVIFTILIFSSSVRQGWFAPHETYVIEFPSGDGLNDGTPVSISGLKAGRVVSVELGENSHVIVQIRVQRKYASRIRTDSKAIVGRPFIIGEKAISLTPGSSDRPVVRPGSKLVGEEALEITDMLSGGRFGPYMATLNSLLEQMRLVIEGDGTPQSAKLFDTYKQLYRSLKAVESLAGDVGHIRKDFIQSPEMKKLVKDMSNSTDDIQQLLVQVNQAMPALVKLSTDVAGVMPDVSKTLGETVLTLQAMQRSFLLRGSVADIKKERAEHERRPASVPETSVESVVKPNHAPGSSFPPN